MDLWKFTNCKLHKWSNADFEIRKRKLFNKV